MPNALSCPKKGLYWKSKVKHRRKTHYDNRHVNGSQTYFIKR